MNRRGPYWLNLLQGLDYFGATLLGIPSGIYISSYVAYKRSDTYGQQPWVFLEQAINMLFADNYHCIKSLAKNRDDIKYYYGG